MHLIACKFGETKKREGVKGKMVFGKCNIQVSLKGDLFLPLIQVKVFPKECQHCHIPQGDPTPPGSEVAWTPVQDPISHEFLNINGPVPYMTQDLTVDMRMAVWAEHYED